jgi:uncharacterized protein (TIGR01244 family)
MGDPADIRGWQRLGPATTTSGRLEEHDPQRLAAIGVRHVINLAVDDAPEALAGEGDKLAALGIAYTHIPVPFDAPGEDHLEAFEAALGANEGPVHVHCIMNWRVSAFFYRLNRAKGMDEAEATALMRQQWDPRRSDDPRAKVWADFLGGGES